MHHFDAELGFLSPCRKKCEYYFVILLGDHSYEEQSWYKELVRLLIYNIDFSIMTR
jgi:hypothetical protein